MTRARAETFNAPQSPKGRRISVRSYQRGRPSADHGTRGAGWFHDIVRSFTEPFGCCLPQRSEERKAHHLEAEQNLQKAEANAAKPAVPAQSENK